MSAAEDTKPPAPMREIPPGVELSPELIALLDERTPMPKPQATPGIPTETFRQLARHFERRITELEEHVDALQKHIAKLEGARAGATKVMGQAVLELVKDDAIKAAIASSLKVVGYAVAVAIIAATGARFAYGDLLIGGGAPDEVNAERATTPEPVTLPPAPGALPDLGTSPDL